MPSLAGRPRAGGLAAHGVRVGARRRRARGQSQLKGVTQHNDIFRPVDISFSVFTLGIRSGAVARSYSRSCSRNHAGSLMRSSTAHATAPPPSIV